MIVVVVVYRGKIERLCGALLGAYNCSTAGEIYICKIHATTAKVVEIALHMENILITYVHLYNLPEKQKQIEIK